MLFLPYTNGKTVENSKSVKALSLAIVDLDFLSVFNFVINCVSGFRSLGIGEGLRDADICRAGEERAVISLVSDTIFRKGLHNVRS